MSIIRARDNENNRWKRNTNEKRKKKKKNKGDGSYSKRVRDKWFSWAFKSGFLQLIYKASYLFPSAKSWALDFSSNLNGNTSVRNNTEKWRSTNAIEQYTNFKQSSDRKLLQWRARTILIRQFKYCLSKF